MTLAEKRCVPCDGKTPSLGGDAVRKLLAEIPEWKLGDDEKSVVRAFHFENYYRTMAFVNAVAWIAHGEDHHPDLEVFYNRCVVRFSTHAVGGLSENDFICAAKVDRLG
jgi:4a-hydroxytetrahydrobiopterin dehydratase